MSPCAGTLLTLPVLPERPHCSYIPANKDGRGKLSSLLCHRLAVVAEARIFCSKNPDVLTYSRQIL